MHAFRQPYHSSRYPPWGLYLIKAKTIDFFEILKTKVTICADIVYISGFLEPLSDHVFRLAKAVVFA